MQKQTSFTGLCAFDDSSMAMTKSEIHMNFRSSGKTKMLSLAFEDKGEITVEFERITALINSKEKDRKNKSNIPLCFLYVQSSYSSIWCAINFMSKLSFVKISSW